MSDPPHTPRTPSPPQPTLDNASGLPNDGAPSLPKHTTPVQPKVATYELFETTESNLKKTRHRILHETAGHFVGPMPVNDFFEDFMPWNEGVHATYKEVKPPQSRVTNLKAIPHSTEADSYTRFVKAFSGWRGLGAPKGMSLKSTSPLKFVDSHKHCDRDCASYSADISVYSGVPFVPRDNEQVMDFANLHCLIEIKPTADFDAFDDGAEEDNPSPEEQENAVPSEGSTIATDDDIEDDGVASNDEEDPDTSDLDRATENPKHPRNFVAEKDDTTNPVTEDESDPRYPFEKTTKRGYDTRAQLASYVGATMATQYRSHFFTVLIAGKRVRFLRWDRASAIVTKSFDLTDEPLLLFEFFKRFRQLSLNQRGSSTHVSPATATEALDARNLLQSLAPELWLGAAGYLFLKSNAIDIRTQSFLKLTFEGRTFIVPAPHCPERGLSPFGRASRGTAAVCIDDGTKKGSVCFLKDGWRDMHRISEPEVYKALAENQIANVANMLCGGDLPASTIGHTYWADKAWVRRGGISKVRQLQGCVIVLDVVGRPLVAFRKAHQLVGALADAMEAYSDALKKAGIMHRDISPYNILIVNTDTEQKGILIDWDHGVRIDPASAKRGLWRTGTWQFMSIALLRNPKAEHTALDDRESAFYVLLWIVIRYLHHNLDQADIRERLTMFDEQVMNIVTWQYVGGGKKELQVPKLRHPTKCIQFKENISEVTDLIRDLARVFSERYVELEPELFPEGVFEAMKQQNAESMALLRSETWLVDKLRGVDKKLKGRQDAHDSNEDWTDNVAEASEKGVPSGIEPWRVSRIFINYTNSHNIKRPTDRDDEEPRSKRVKTSSSLD